VQKKAVKTHRLG